MSGFVEDFAEDFSERTNRRGEETEQFSESYSSDSYGRAPPPPQVPWPWQARWHERERRYFFVHAETGEEIWDYDEVIRRTRGGGERVYESESMTYESGGYGRRGYGGGYGGGGYGGERVYESEEVVEERRRHHGGGGYGGERVYESEEVVEEGRRHHGGGHGMAYGAIGGVAGLAAGAGLMYEGEKIHNDWDRDKYRVENDVDNFPENAAQWTGDKVGEAEYDVDRFDNRVDQRWDNTVNDVEYAPEEAANWVGQGVGDVERFDDNVEASYDEGRYEGRNDW